MKFPTVNLSIWKSKFRSDFVQKDFMPIKVLFFLIFGANVSLVPFLTLQARSLGITEEEVGLIYSFIPIAALIAPPLSGMLADKIGNFRILLSIVTAIAGLSSLIFLAVPVGRMTHTLPDKLPLQVICSPNFGNKIQVLEPYKCEPSEKNNEFPVHVGNCVFTCFKSENSSDEISDRIGEPNLSCRNSKECETTSSTDYFLQGETDFNLTMETYFSRSKNLTTEISVFERVMIQPSPKEGDVIYNTNQLICPKFEQNVSEPQNCLTICSAETPREEMCSNAVSIQEFDPSLTFYSHLAIRLLKEFTLATSMPLLEGAAVTILREHNGDFGFQRMYCNVGMMVMTPISGALIDYFSSVNGMEDFSPAIYMYCGLKLLAALIMLFLNLEFKEASNRVIADFSSLILKPEILIFLLATFCAGICYGYIETFLFWLLADLGADKKLMGITITVGSVFGIPLLMMSTYILNKLGHVNTIVLGFAVYIIRLFGYTIISNPWWAMPFEALECFTVSLMVVAFVSYAAILASPTTIVTLQGMYGGIYNGVGRGAGSLIGGFLIENLDIFTAFRIIAAIGGASGLAYFLINVCFFRKRRLTSVIDIADGEKAKEADGGRAAEKGSVELSIANRDKYEVSLRTNSGRKEEAKAAAEEAGKENAAFRHTE